MDEKFDEWLRKHAAEMCRQYATNHTPAGVMAEALVFNLRTWMEEQGIRLVRPYPKVDTAH